MIGKYSLSSNKGISILLHRHLIGQTEQIEAYAVPLTVTTKSLQSSISFPDLYKWAFDLVYWDINNQLRHSVSLYQMLEYHYRLNRKRYPVVSMMG